MHVIAPAAFGGAESVVRSLVEGLSGRGHRVAVALLLEEGERAPHPFESVLVERGIEVRVVRVRARAYRSEARVLAEIFANDRPEAVHTHGFRADIQGGRVAGRLGIPRVSTVHGFTGGGARVRLYECLQVLALRRFETVIAVSRPLETVLARKGVPAARLHLVRNAWSGGSPSVERSAARAELKLPPDAFVVGWAGRLSTEKGGDILVDAIALLEDPSLLVCVVGDGPERPILERRVAELGLSKRVRWSGIVPNAGRLFRAFDAFVLSSRTEGTPIVLFEAMDAGVPIVATAVGGVPDVVGEREAWLVEPNDPGALARALRELNADPAAAMRRTEAARRRLDTEFAATAWLEAHEQVYRQAVERVASTSEDRH